MVSLGPAWNEIKKISQMFITSPAFLQTRNLRGYLCDRFWAGKFSSSGLEGNFGLGIENVTINAHV